MLQNIFNKPLSTYSHYEKLSFVSLSYMHSASFACIIHFSCSKKKKRQWKCFVFILTTIEHFLALAKVSAKRLFLSQRQHHKVFNFKWRFETWTPIMKVFSTVIESAVKRQSFSNRDWEMHLTHKMPSQLSDSCLWSWIGGIIFSVSALMRLFLNFCRRLSRCRIKESAWPARGEWNLWMHSTAYK